MRLSMTLIGLLLWAGSGVALAEEISDDDVVIVAVQPRNADIKPVIITLPTQVSRESAAPNPQIKLGNDDSPNHAENRPVRTPAQDVVLSGL